MAFLDDEINDLKQSIADQLRETQELTENINLALRGRVKIESEIERMQRGLDTLEDRNLALEEQITDTRDKLADKKNNQKRRRSLAARLERELALQKSVVDSMNNLRQNIDRRSRRMENIDGLIGDLETRRTLGGGNVDALNESLAELEDHNDRLMKAERDAYKEEERRNKKRQDEEDRRQAEQAEKQEGLINNLKSSLLKLATAISQIVMSGIEFARTVNTSRTRGVGLDFENRLRSVFQFTDADRFATNEQMRQAQQALIQTMGGVREGMQLSSTGARNFAQELNTGFGTEFQMTSGALRALITTGISTEQQFEQFRKATGKAALSSTTFERIVSNNTRAFMLGGMSFAKAALEAERLGFSFEEVRNAQTSMITNLEGTLQTVAELQQLGARGIEFGTLVNLAEFDPTGEKVLDYVQQNMPDYMFRTTSTRATLEKLGISTETIMKRMGSVQQQTADKIESKMTEAERETSNFTKSVTGAVNYTQNLTRSFGGLITATGAVIASFWTLARTAPGAFGGKAGMGSALTGAAAGTLFGTSVGGSLASSLGGSIAGGLATAGLGRVIGGALGTFLGGPIGTVIGMSLGGLVGGGISSMMKANDMVSNGYGNRVLVSPKGSIALNNSDTVVAGTNLGGGGNGDLIRKIDQLIAKINEASTVIEIGGQRQRVSRLSLVGVNARYDAE